MKQEAESKHSVVIVDDDPDALSELAEMVQGPDIAIWTARNAREGLEAVRTHFPVDVLISEVKMPGPSGLTLTTTVREELGAHSPQIILLSGQPSNDVLARAIRSGAVDFLFKPLDPEAIEAALARALMRSASVDTAVGPRKGLAEGPVREAQMDPGGQEGTETAAEVPSHSSTQDFLFWLAQERRVRCRYFDPEVCHEPAWAILAELAHTLLLGKRECVSSVAAGADIPTTTALRHIETLEEKGLVERFADANDRRRTEVKLTDEGYRLLQQYVAAVSSPGKG
jgi:CheY-like chemotaxis protein/predicted transcriptional regulator